MHGIAPFKTNVYVRELSNPYTNPFPFEVPLQSERDSALATILPEQMAPLWFPNNEPKGTDSIHCVRAHGEASLRGYGMHVLIA
jgi:hypothetical protein